MANVQPVTAVQDCVYHFSPMGCQRADCTFGGHDKPTYSDLEQEIQRLGIALLEQQQVLSDKIKQVHSLEEQLTTMARQNITIREKNTALYQTNDNLYQENASLKHENAVLIQLYNSLDKEHGILKERYTSVFSAYNNVSRKNGNLHQEIEALRKKKVSKKNKKSESKSPVQGKTGDTLSKTAVATAPPPTSNALLLNQYNNSKIATL